jgi:hypothetical protein
LFIIGGVLGLLFVILALPIASVYPFRTFARLDLGYVVGMIVVFFCSLEAFGCAARAADRLADSSGIRGVAIGVILLFVSTGVVAALDVPGFSTQIGTLVSALILIAGVICIALRSQLDLTEK